MAEDITEDTPITFIVKEKSLIGNEIHEAGDIITLPKGTLPAENLEATDARGQKLKDDYVASNKKRVADMNAQFAAPAPANGGVDPATLGALIQVAVKAAMDAQAAEQAELKDKLAAAEATIAAAEKAAAEASHSTQSLA